MTSLHDGLAARAQELLVELAGPAAVLRDDQLAAIEALVAERRRTLVVQRTGWGKSAVYFLATRLLRDQRAGPTLLVSPLLALMRDQIGNARRVGIRAETINSTNLDDWSGIEGRLLAGEVDLVCVSPERLNAPGFRDEVLPRLAGQIGLLVVDEAHCISDWGHDFRPDYRRIRDLLARLEGVPVLACTATANDRVMADVADQLGADTLALRGSLDRESLALSVAELPTAERLAYAAELVATLDGSGIVYTLTVAEAERVAAFLSSTGPAVAAYSSNVESAERERIEADLKDNRLKAVVATSALGMGFDKADLAWVLHMGAVSSPVAYYQHVGRAGRGIPRAEAILLPGSEDRRIWEFFDSTAFPPEPLVRSVLACLDRAGGRTVSLTALEETVNLGRTRLEAVLKVIDVDGAVERVQGGYRATGRPWVYDTARLARVAATRKAEQAAMEAYVRTDGCRMMFLRSQLDDPSAAPCGRCDNCTGARRSFSGDASAAREFLQAQDVVLPVRKAWPRGLATPKGNIAPALRAEQGRALCSAGDGGWSPLVGPILEGAAPLSDEVVAGFARMLRRWDWPRRPTWVTFVPSVRNGPLVAELAGRVSAMGRMTLIEAFTRRADRPAQAEMANSAHQLLNVWDALELTVPPGALPAGPVLLIDDLAASTWTLTVAAARLREAGAQAVLPAVLAYRR